jgi:hypothetical protein
MTGSAFLPWSHSTVGQGYRVLSGGDICPETLILLDNTYFMAFLTDDIPVLTHLHIYERFLNWMAGGAKVGIILGILIISIPIEKKGKDYYGEYEPFNIVRNGHSNT